MENEEWVDLGWSDRDDKILFLFIRNWQKPKLPRRNKSHKTGFYFGASSFRQFTVSSVFFLELILEIKLSLLYGENLAKPGFLSAKYFFKPTNLKRFFAIV